MKCSKSLKFALIISNRIFFISKSFELFSKYIGMENLKTLKLEKRNYWDKILTQWRGKKPRFLKVKNSLLELEKKFIKRQRIKRQINTKLTKRNRRNIF